MVGTKIISFLWWCPHATPTVVIVFWDSDVAGKGNAQILIVISPLPHLPLIVQLFLRLLCPLARPLLPDRFGFGANIGHGMALDCSVVRERDVPTARKASSPAPGCTLANGRSSPVRNALMKMPDGPYHTAADQPHPTLACGC